jgi:hypothetical protein
MQSFQQSRKPTKNSKKVASRKWNNALKQAGLRIPQQKRAQRQPKKQGRRRNRNATVGSLLRNAPSINRFPLGNRQGTGFGTRAMITISESEFISEYAVANQPNFNVGLNLPINPGQATTFPWLSTIAKQYEKYRFKSLRFIYKPEVTQFNPTSAAVGKVMMNCDYDASDAPPTSKQQVEDTKPHADCMPYEQLVLVLNPFEMHVNSDAKYVRPAGLPGGTDIKTYDCGNLYVSNQGQTANAVNLGELHVDYIVELSIPILESTNKAPINYQVTSFQDTSAALTTNTSYQPLLAAAASGTVVNVNGLGVVNTAGSIVPPPGNYYYSVVSSFFASGMNMTQCELLFYKNGSQQGPAALMYSSAYLGEYQTLNLSGYITCNGTDAITLAVISLFGTGTVACSTVFNLLAV